MYKIIFKIYLIEKVENKYKKNYIFNKYLFYKILKTIL